MFLCVYSLLYSNNELWHVGICDLSSDVMDYFSCEGLHRDPGLWLHLAYSTPSSNFNNLKTPTLICSRNIFTCLVSHISSHNIPESLKSAFPTFLQLWCCKCGLLQLALRAKGGTIVCCVSINDEEDGSRWWVQKTETGKNKCTNVGTNTW